MASQWISLISFIEEKLGVQRKVIVQRVILDITAMAQEKQELLTSVILVISVNVELKCQSLTMTPLEGFAQEEASVKQETSQKNVVQVQEHSLVMETLR